MPSPSRSGEPSRSSTTVREVVELGLDPGADREALVELAVDEALRGVAIDAVGGLRYSQRVAAFGVDIELVEPAELIGGANHRPHVGTRIEDQVLAQAQDSETAHRVAVPAGIREQVGRVHLVAEEVDIARGPDPEHGPLTEFTRAEVDVESEVAVVGRGARPDGHPDGVREADEAVAEADHVAALAERPLGRGLEAGEGAELAHELVALAIAGPQAEVEHARERVAVLGGEGGGREVGGAEHIGVERTHRPARRPEGGEVVRARDGDALELPEESRGRVAADHDVVAGVVGGGDAGEVGGQATHVRTAAGEAVDLLGGEAPRRDGGEFVDGGGGVDLRGHGGGAELLEAFLEGGVELEVLADGHQQTRDDAGLVADVGDAHGLAADGYAGEGVAAVEVGRGADGGVGAEDFDGGADEWHLRLCVGEDAGDGLGR